MADYKSTHTGAEIDAGIDKAVTADTNWNLLMANLGIGRWANQTFKVWSWDATAYFYDSLSNSYTDLSRYLAYSKFDITDKDITMSNDYTRGVSCQFMFYNFDCSASLFLSNMVIGSSFGMFMSSKFSKILIKEGCSVKLNGYSDYMFAYCSNLTEIGALDCSGANNLPNIFRNCEKLKSIHCTHFQSSFNISSSTAFEEADLVEIINNLDTVTSTQTLTMGATNLAKLTDAEKKVATDKGWVLA